MSRENLSVGRVSRAYDAGYEDGLNWDLDGFADWAAVDRQTSGWDESTINAIGSDKFAHACGVTKTEGPAWETACREYNRGAHRGACERDRSTTLPRSETVE